MREVRRPSMICSPRKLRETTGASVACLGLCGGYSLAVVSPTGFSNRAYEDFHGRSSLLLTELVVPLALRLRSLNDQR